MRKRIYTKQIGVTLTADTFMKILEGTTHQEISTSAWLRDAIEKKLILDESSKNDQLNISRKEKIS